MKRNAAVWTVAVAALLLVTPEAFAATAAGTKIRNTASVSYKIGGVDQTAPADGEVDFVVDRRVDLSVSALDYTIDTSPGAEDVAAIFQVTNDTNDVVDMQLNAYNMASGTVTAGPDGAIPAPDDTDNIPSTEAMSAGFTLYYDDGDGFDGDETEVEKDGSVYYIPDMAAGASINIVVVADAIPAQGDEGDASKVQDGDYLAISLEAEARSAYDDPTGATGLTWVDIDNGDGTPVWDPAAATDLGDAFAETTNDNTATVQTVFADSADTDSSSAAGQAGEEYNARDASYVVYEVAAASITVTKSSAVYWDPINGFTNPKAIPGAVVLYCVSVENGGSSDAESVKVTDNVPTNTVFEEGGTDTDSVTVGTQPLDPDGAAATYPALDNTNSIRFSTASSCTAADWDDASLVAPPAGSEVEDSDALTEGTGAIGNYNAGTISTTVDTLDGSGGRTTTMFLVKIQ